MWAASLLMICSFLGADTDQVPLSLLGRHDLLCPVCKQVFTTVVCTQTNTRAGVDRDLFARALGPQPEFYRVFTCPQCGYSGYAADFDPDITIPPDVRRKILTSPKLPKPKDFTPQSDPREIDAATRYALTIQCYRWRGKSDEALGWLYLRSAWVAREEGSSLPRDKRLALVMGYIERWRPSMRDEDNQTDIEMQLATRVTEALAGGQFNRFQRPYVELALGLILRRHGENRQATPLLDHLLSDPLSPSSEANATPTGAPAGRRRTSARSSAGRTSKPKEEEVFLPTLRDAITRMRKSIETETQLQRKAAECFERALITRQIVGQNRGPACYVLGELYRRLGRDADALRWYDLALKEPDLPTDMHTWATQQRPVAGQ